MGLEVGWYLRFSSARIIEALVTRDGLGQIVNHLAPDMGWRLESEPSGEAVLARLTRTNPRRGT